VERSTTGNTAGCKVITKQGRGNVRGSYFLNQVGLLSLHNPLLTKSYAACLSDWGMLVGSRRAPGMRASVKYGIWSFSCNNPVRERWHLGS
jgi:hypothetical protein